MNIIFAGTPSFACTALESIHRSGHVIGLVLTQPDRPKGRGLKLLPSPVKEYALLNGLPVLQPPSLRLDGRFPEEARTAHERLRNTPHDAMVVAAYGLILPQAILDIPQKGCLNIHASLLPRWRGAAPIQRAIEAGDDLTGVSIMQMEAGLDTGPVLLQKSLAIGEGETAGELSERLARLGAGLIVQALAALEIGDLAAVPQPQEGMTYAAKITREEARLNFNRSASVIARQVRAFNPAPGSHAEYRDVSLKIWSAQARALDHRAPPGTVLQSDGDSIAIACAQDVLLVYAIQKPGGQRLAARAFLKGFPIQPGTRFA